jgi:aminoglycoside phosphotransferase (APT) family kinase protein
LQTDAAAWEEVLQRVASVQRASLGRAERLLAAGAPDFRPHTVAARLEQLVEDLRLVGDERRRVLAMVPGIASAAADLQRNSIGVGISHGDLQPNNLLAPPTSKPFDWGDAVVAHPFCTLTSMRWSIDDQQLFNVVRDAYLSEWTDMADITKLRRIAECAELVGCVASIWTWVRVGPAGIALHPASIPAWFERIELGLTRLGS